ncbi:DUF6183 family protein [Kitasatospora kifunensis]|uniref:Uncharacterized protein n=1 Tax=Kitasatospora kifunensis TaxID=58351 RepID=A0A7W7R8H0_KITKI|nr:DUF6183 family protein [Kitasatospora kifunensis]MBB4927348.1 hypothetical protein [Kitasatospora kifunensis]
MDKDITRTVKALCETDDSTVSLVRSEVESRLSSGEFDWAGDLGLELAARIAAGEDQHGRCADVLYRTLHALAAHPEPESLRALLRVLASPHRGGLERAVSPRSLAAVAAGGRRIESIVSVVFDRESESAYVHEFSACLLHELVLVADGVDEHPALRSFADTLLAEGHPLAALPLRLLPEEHGLRRPPGAADDWTWTVPRLRADSLGLRALETTPSMHQRVDGIDATEIGLPASAEAIGAAAGHWLGQSNGKLAAQEFWLLDPVAEEDFPAVFGRLPLAPWPADQAPAKLYPSTPDLVFRLLLTTAVRAPAYGPGRHGAYGRLAAWQSLGGLTGSPAAAPPAQIAELVRRTSWFRVDTTSAWFYGIYWDLAVAALRPGGQEIAVLAATDTD